MDGDNMRMAYRTTIYFGICACGILAGPFAQAQTSATLYGIADGSILYTSRTLNPATGTSAGSQWLMQDSGLTASRFGLRGSEDLGGEFKANFNIESGINIANGGLNNSNGNFFGRQAWVSLSGRFGEVKGGLQYTPFFLATVASDPRNFSQFGSGLVTYSDAVLGTSIFTSNAVSYTSPSIAGFSASALIALGGTPGQFQAGRQYSASVTYSNGPLMFDAAFFNGNQGQSAQIPPSTTLDFIGRTLGVSYRAGRVTAKASVTNYHVAGAFNNYVYSVGLDSLVMADLDVNGGVWITRDHNVSENHSLMAALGCEYYLSKRTTLYSQLGLVNNHGAMNTGLSVSAMSTLYSPRGTTVGANVGIRHAF